MWRYRELIRILTLSDFKTRYQNTTLGFFWSILSPLLLALVLYFVFKNLFAQEEDFAVNLIVGIMAWRFFTIGTTAALGSIVGKPNLVTKIYLPRQILVLSTTSSILISSLLEFLVLILIILVLLGHLPVTLPLFLMVHLLFFMLIYGIGLFLASLFVYFRDINQIWEVLVNILFFCSPIIYPLSIVPDNLMTLYMLNPITRIIILYREVMVAGNLPSVIDLLIVAAFSLAAYVVGTFVFSKLQRRFAEEI